MICEIGEEFCSIAAILDALYDLIIDWSGRGVSLALQASSSFLIGTGTLRLFPSASLLAGVTNAKDCA